MDNDHLPFGGVLVVLIDNFKQLSLVNALPLWSTPERDPMSMFQRIGLIKVFKDNFKDIIVPTENMRQAGDPAFQAL